MARKPRWNSVSYEAGVKTVNLFSWKYFHDYLKSQNLLEKRTYIYRGQSDSSWSVRPSVNRSLPKSVKGNLYLDRIDEHLENFKYSIRGKVPGLKDILNDEDELWALGQHHGLKTPFLDFSTSPFVAAYFAFADTECDSDHRTVWMLAATAIDNYIDDQLEMYRPLSDITPRLISQDGLFVKFNDNKDLESIIKSTKEKSLIFLYKINIPNKDRKPFLRSLNRMNINHKTLFPDLHGASLYTNLHLEVDKY